MKTYRFYLVVISLLLPACGGIYYAHPLQDGAGVKIDRNEIKNAQPIEEPITKAGNTNPYTQFGITYEIMPSSLGYREVGNASWYGSKFHGRRTSNGDIYDMYSMTAAHKTLPIPTYVRVTRVDTSKPLSLESTTAVLFMISESLIFLMLQQLNWDFPIQGQLRCLLKL